VVGGVRNTISTVDLRAAQNRLRIEEDKRKDVNLKRDIAVDSLRTYQRQILELDNNADVAGELGPLKYIAGLTGYPMDKIINVLLLIIIFVFDPLAVSLVVAANFAYNQAFPKKKYRENLYEEKVEVEEKPNVFDDYSEEDEKRMDIIGQNGNEGEHYEISREEQESIVEKGIQDAIKGKAGATPANFNRITARKILDNLDNLTKTY
jgi:hypothetical protein